MLNKILSNTADPIHSKNTIATFFYFAIPSVIGLVAITTSHLVDGMFVGNFVGHQALAAVTLLVPYFTFLFAVSLMLAIGGSVHAGKHIGSGDIKAASAVFSKVMIATLLINLLFALASLAFEKSLFSLLKVPDPLLPLVSEYLAIIRWTMVIQLPTMVLYYFVRADGQPVLATSSLICGALLNILLDALLIVHFEMGLSGAALATLFSQILQFGVLGRYFFNSNRTLRLSLLQSRWSSLIQTSYYGISGFISELSVGLIFLILNALLLARLGIEGVAAFSVANYFIFLSIMLCFGISDALRALVSQNYGARQFERIRQFLNISLCCVLTLGCGMILLLLFCKEPLIHWFLETDAVQVAGLASEMLLLIWPIFLINGVNIVLGCYMTAMHQPRAAAMIATTRSLLLPCSLLFALYYFLHRWQPLAIYVEHWSFLAALPLAEWGTFLLAVTLKLRHDRNSFSAVEES